MEECNYENAEDDTYEMVDTDPKGRPTRVVQRSDSEKYSYGYLVPTVKESTAPRTVDSYLLPSILNKS